VFAALVALAARLLAEARKKRPSSRKPTVAIICILWLVVNIIAMLIFGISSSVITLVLIAAAIPAAAVYSQLHQFWRVGLVAVDRETANGLDYATALNMCNSDLEFLGIGASKLTRLYREFEGAITRCSRPDRAIKFLLSRPDAEGLRRIATLAGRDPSEYQHTVQESLRMIADFRTRRGKHIEVRFYRDFPAFRIMFINDSTCLISHYVLGKGDGSNLPQLQLIKMTDVEDIKSLFYGFRYYFDSIWREAEAWDFQQYL
jgi:hypothetical protein